MPSFTGHPLVDVGLATITAFADKARPEDLIEADYDAIADYMARNYVVNPLKSFLTVAFPNSGFTQPAFEKTPDRRKAYAERVLRCYKEGTPILSTERCVFTGLPAIGLALDDKNRLPPGRAFRQHIPMVTGEDIINFHPYGDAGIHFRSAAARSQADCSRSTAMMKTSWCVLPRSSSKRTAGTFRPPRLGGLRNFRNQPTGSGPCLLDACWTLRKNALQPAVIRNFRPVSLLIT
ncbi:MAG: hypothetical protein JRI39_12205 [Deltaproteobacteria bacterium]|nr:hypothetical protein [Deltaproteobacteria bacterium]